MPTFEFDDGGAGANQTTTVTSANAALNFTEDGVDFTFSTVNPSGTAALYYSPGAPGGALSFSDFNNTGMFTLAVNAATNNLLRNPALNVATISGTWTVTFVHATNAALNQQVTGLTSANTGAITAPAGDYSSIMFTASSGGGGFMAIQSLTAEIVCFLGGTGIATPDGRVAVEDLRPGDRVLLADGRSTEVKWVGVLDVDTRLTHPAKVNPVCITAGALGGGLPERDLLVSPEHAIEIDGTLYNAGTLVNGETIYRKARMPKEGFTYYHIETDSHELLLAEGVPAESYIDYLSRDRFDNPPEADGRVIPEMALLRVSAARLVPAELKARLQEIAGQARVAA